MTKKNKKTEEEAISDYLKSLNFICINDSQNYYSRRMTKNRKEYEWKNGNMTISYEISKDIRKQNYNRIIDRDIRFIKNDKERRIASLCALKKDVALNRIMKMRKLTAVS